MPVAISILGHLLPAREVTTSICIRCHRETEARERNRGAIEKQRHERGTRRRYGTETRTRAPHPPHPYLACSCQHLLYALCATVGELCIYLLSSLLSPLSSLLSLLSALPTHLCMHSSSIAIACLSSICLSLIEHVTGSSGCCCVRSVSGTTRGD